jgi:hypothetical protein
VSGGVGGAGCSAALPCPALPCSMLCVPQEVCCHHVPCVAVHCASRACGPHTQPVRHLYCIWVACHYYWVQGRVPPAILLSCAQGVSCGRTAWCSRASWSGPHMLYAAAGALCTPLSRVYALCPPIHHHHLTRRTCQCGAPATSPYCPVGSCVLDPLVSVVVAPIAGPSQYLGGRPAGNPQRAAAGGTALLLLSSSAWCCHDRGHTSTHTFARLDWARKKNASGCLLPRNLGRACLAGPAANV